MSRFTRDTEYVVRTRNDDGDVEDMDIFSNEVEAYHCYEETLQTGTGFTCGTVELCRWENRWRHSRNGDTTLHDRREVTLESQHA